MHYSSVTAAGYNPYDLLTSSQDLQGVSAAMRYSQCQIF